MKNIFSLVLHLLLVTPIAHSQVAVQRTTESSYEEYLKYLSKSGHKSFVQSYIHLASVTEMETPLLEKCLEEIYVGVPSQNTCLSAVKSLTSKPLNQARREVLFSFLSKLEKIKSSQHFFYLKLKQGLLWTHPDMSRIFQAPMPEAETKADKIQDLEMKAWKKALLKRFPIDEVALLINGKKVSRLENWSAPAGIFQWTLVSNTHEPIIRLASFSQFAAESIKDLKPLALGKCENLNNLEEKKFGLLYLEVFATTKCVSQFGLNRLALKPDHPHLGNSTSLVKMESTSQRHWVWPVVALIGVGLASSLQNKQVSVQWPSLQ